MQPLAETVVCQKRTSTHRIVFMDMMNEMAVSPSTQPSDEVNFLNATVVCGHAGRFRPGSWIFVRPGSEKTWQFDKWTNRAIQEETGFARLVRLWKLTPNATQPSRNDDLRAG